MSRRLKIVRNIAIGVVALVAGLGVAGILIVQTDWFRNYVKQKIIASTEESTGGKVEVGSFRFDWRHLRAAVTDFVIHGNEPAGAAPFLIARDVQLVVRPFTSIHHFLDVAYLGIDQPQANIIVFPDGRTNVPTPKTALTSKESPVQTVVDLAVGHFVLTNGQLVFASQKQALNVRASNLRAQLWFNVLKQRYAGQISLQPLYVVSGRNTPVDFTLTLPVAMQGDRVEFHDATITTPETKLLINGAVENLRDPKLSAHINGQVALVDLKNAFNVPLALGPNIPSSVDVDASATASNNRIEVTGLRMGIGHSDIEASGTLKDTNGARSLEFKSRLALGELGRLAKLAARPDGNVLLNGTAKLDASNNYQVAGNIQAKGLSFQQGAQRINDVNLFSAVYFDPHNLDLKGLWLAILSGEFAGDVALQDFAHYKVHGNLRNLNLRALAHAMGLKQFGYDGKVSGPMDAEGDLKATPTTRGLTAHVRLAIAPGRQGIPVSGRLNADYSGASDNLRVENSYFMLPHTRLTLNGSVSNQLNISLTTSDANDLVAATPIRGKSPVSLNDRQASFIGTVTGGLTSPRFSGHVAVTGFSVDDRKFDSLTADAAVSGTGASIRNGSLTRGTMQTQFSGQVGLKNWQATPNQPLSADATIRNGDLPDILALAGQTSADYSGALSATMHLGGTVGDPVGTANLLAMNGTLEGEPFDRIQAQVNLSDKLVTIPIATLEAGAARVNLSVELRHPRDSFTTGQLHAHMQSNQVDLAQLRNLQKRRPNTAGLLQTNVDMTGKIAPKEFFLTAVSGNVSARGLQFEGENYGDVNATARTSGQTVSYNLTSNFAGSNIHLSGNTQLTREYPTTADANIQNLPIERVLAVAQRKDFPAKGNLSGTAHFSGTSDNPQGNVDVDLANAVLYDEPMDHLRAKAEYLSKTIEVRQLQIVSGPSHIDLSGRFEHTERNLQAGNLQFQVNSSDVDLGRIHNVQTRRPGLGGTVQLTANGSAEIRDAEPRVLVRDLKGNLAANRIVAQGKNYGDLKLTASTEGGKVNFVLGSNLASSNIQGHGSAQLVDHYPVDAQLTFSNVTWTKLQGLISQKNDGSATFDVAADGQVTVHGPVMKPEELRGSAQLSRLQVSSIPGSKPGAKPVTLQNRGPIAATIERQLIRIDSAHLTGRQTDIQAKGTVSLKDQSMDLTLSATANLQLLQDFDRDISSSGNVVLATTVRGTVTDPLVNGKMELHNGSFNYLEFPNGIQNANGVVQFNGNSASVHNLTAESAGGKLTIGGFVVMSDNPRFGLRANASSVRVRLEQGISIVTDANVNLTGTRDGSQLSGTTTIKRIAYAPQTDLGSLMSRAAPPVQTTSASPLFDNMKIDIRMQTSDALAVQTSLAASLQGQADLRIRGTASHPGVLGRITITEGTMTLFSSTYVVNSGTIAFYNPVRVEPMLDLNLETHAKGVDVIVRVTGPIDNMKLSYTSDPPLQFQEIISLLAAGNTPTSDPTLLANQPAQPPQTFQQMGESALMSKALSDPVASRLQRVFGVSQLKVDPTFTSGSQLPQAQLTLQQQVTNNVTFTYLSALDNANATTIRVEVTLNPQWSAVATRDQNGIFSVNLLYKRQIR